MGSQPSCLVFPKFLLLLLSFDCADCIACGVGVRLTRTNGKVHLFLLLPCFVELPLSDIRNLVALRNKLVFFRSLSAFVHAVCVAIYVSRFQKHGLIGHPPNNKPLRCLLFPSCCFFSKSKGLRRTIGWLLQGSALLNVLLAYY